MEAPPQETKETPLPLGPSGLGGWLILIQIGLYSSLLGVLVYSFTVVPGLFAPEYRELFASRDSEFYHPLLFPMIGLELLALVLFLPFTIYILFNFYRKKAIVPRLMIIYYSAVLVVSLISIAFMFAIPLFDKADKMDEIRTVVRNLLTCAIFIPYFLKSDRVHNTFVR